MESVENKKLMGFCCCLGLHDYVRIAEGCVYERWHKIDLCVKIPDSDYQRRLFTIIEQCEKCGKRKAYRMYEDTGEIITRISVEMAVSEIEKIMKKIP